ncbi:MAG: LLM class flavin-dependent oxidoreductase, partial [Acidobacteriota bacterium]
MSPIRSKAESSGGLKLSLFDLLDHYPERGASLEDRYRDHLDRAVCAEGLGFHGVFVAEHHFSDFGVAPNPAVFLAAVAARTDRIRLGPAVAVLPFRHPMQVVEDYSMVDQLSGGRLVLAVGSGSEASEFRGFGLDPATKRAAFDDRLPVVAAAFSSRSDAGQPRSPLATAPPIFLAATSPGGARAAGSGGFGLLTLASPGTESLDDVIARIHAYRTGQGRREQNPRTDGVIVTVLCHLAVGVEKSLERRRRFASCPGAVLGEVA